MIALGGQESPLDQTRQRLLVWPCDGHLPDIPLLVCAYSSWASCPLEWRNREGDRRKWPNLASRGFLMCLAPVPLVPSAWPFSSSRHEAAPLSCTVPAICPTGTRRPMSGMPAGSNRPSKRLTTRLSAPSDRPSPGVAPTAGLPLTYETGEALSEVRRAARKGFLLKADGQTGKRVLNVIEATPGLTGLRSPIEHGPLLTRAIVRARDSLPLRTGEYASSWDMAGTDEAGKQWLECLDGSLYTWFARMQLEPFSDHSWGPRAPCPAEGTGGQKPVGRGRMGPVDNLCKGHRRTSLSGAGMVSHKALRVSQ